MTSSTKLPAVLVSASRGHMIPTLQTKSGRQTLTEPETRWLRSIMAHLEAHHHSGANSAGSTRIRQENKIQVARYFVNLADIWMSIIGRLRLRGLFFCCHPALPPQLRSEENLSTSQQFIFPAQDQKYCKNS